MINQIDRKILSPEDLDLAISKGELQNYLTNAVLIYKGHIPYVGHILFEGEFILHFENHEYRCCTPGFFIGIDHLLNREPINFQLSVSKNTQIITLNLFMINSLLKKNDEKNTSFLKKILNFTV